jgi:hypothetical protein
VWLVGAVIRVVTALADRAGFGRGGVRGLAVSIAKLLLGGRQQRIAALRAVAPFDQALAARCPRVGLTGVPQQGLHGAPGDRAVASGP